MDIADIWKALDDVKDPEIPVVSVVEMGIVRAVALEGDAVIVTMTPTFSGCPALDVMRDDIAARLEDMGFDHVDVRTQLNPPWSSDMIADEARDKLKAFGLAPPPKHGGAVELVLMTAPVVCPRCGSARTTLRNSFGPTLCRAIYVCDDCAEPFEQFKPL